MDAKLTNKWKNRMIVETQKLAQKHHLKENQALKDNANHASRSRPFYVGGLDLSGLSPADQSELICGYVIYKFEGPNCTKPKLVYWDSTRHEVKVPYKAGFLGFRESGPMVATVKKQLKSRPELKPDVILVDGNGIFHPKRFGSACHLGKWFFSPNFYKRLPR